MDYSQLLQYGSLGLVAYLAHQIVMPVLKDYVFPNAQAQNGMKLAMIERQVRSTELLAQTMGEFRTILATMDQRLATVERDQSSMRDDMTVVVERLPQRRSVKPVVEVAK